MSFGAEILGDRRIRKLSGDAKAALEICRQPMERIDLLLAEVTMPQVGSGRVLVDLAARLRPRMKVIYMSRNVDLLLSQGVLTPDMAYLPKAFYRD